MSLILKRNLCFDVNVICHPVHQIGQINIFTAYQEQILRRYPDGVGKAVFVFFLHELVGVVCPFFTLKSIKKKECENGKEKAPKSLFPIWNVKTPNNFALVAEFMHNSFNVWNFTYQHLELWNKWVHEFAAFTSQTWGIIVIAPK